MWDNGDFVAIVVHFKIKVVNGNVIADDATFESFPWDWGLILLRSGEKHKTCFLR
jgi:hypothetical protein